MTQGARRRLLCFGDSNTWGYDPRSYFGDCYPHPWTTLLDGDWEVLNAGQNGREVPRRSGELALARDLLDRAGSVDAMTVLLGDNDLLMDPRLTAEDVAERMEAFLKAILPHPSLREAAVLLIAPAHLRRGAWVAEERLITETARLGMCYEALAQRLGVDFADAGTWDIPMAFDGVHFTEEGHRIFAHHIDLRLRELAER